jgi:hypothetical protein
MVRTAARRDVGAAEQDQAQEQAQDQAEEDQGERAATATPRHGRRARGLRFGPNRAPLIE